MKSFLIGIDNERFEAEIVRYFQNVNDKYLVYTKGEKDANGYVLLYATKVLSDSGIKIGENITDENEWALVKSFLQKTVSENKEGIPVSINDLNPVEINDLKINAQRPFKLSESAVELFGKNKKSFEIVQKMQEAQNIVKEPVAPEFTEFVENKPETTEVPEIQTQPVENSVSEIPAVEPINNDVFSFELPQDPVTIGNDSSEESEAVVPSQPSVTEAVVPSQPSVTEAVQPVESTNYEELYNNEVEKNKKLTEEIEQLLKDNAEYKAKFDKLKELLA